MTDAVEPAVDKPRDRRSFLFESKRVGDHVEVTVRAGIKGSRALCGTLVLAPEDWAMLHWAMSTAPYPRAVPTMIPRDGMSDRFHYREVRELVFGEFEFDGEHEGARA